MKAKTIRFAKVWYQSKTLWVNLIALIALVSQSQYGFIIPVEEQAALLIVINLFVRLFTGQPITFSRKK